jgi:signal transduction histidine kinase
MRATWRSPMSGYLVALGSTAIVVLLRFALADWLHDRVPLLLPLIVAVFLASWCGGLKPGLLATVLGLLVGMTVLSSQATGPSYPMTDRVRLVMFLMEGLAISGSFEAMHKIRRRLERKRHQLEEEVRERKRVEQELVEADRLKNEFLATLAHELRNPLAPIRNCLEIMHRSQDEPALREQTHRMMERQVQQMVRLVDDLLDVSRISRNKVELRKEPISLGKVVQGAVETSQPLIQASGHELTISLPAEPILLDADPIRLAQMFSNLLNNAAKYMEPGGNIMLTAEKRETEVVVTVRDSGIGIPTHMLSRIFEMFMQVGAAQERSHGGLGIGLSLVKWLAEMHGGRVEARSDGPGKGSEFVVYLPIFVGADAQQTDQPTDHTQRPVASASHRVLVVDDNEDAVSSMQTLLTALGNEVLTAYDGVEAVEAAAAFHPDVVMLDLGMPRMNGYDAARQIRAQAWGKGMVLIAHTGWGQEEDRCRTKEAGFDYHLVKPVAPDTLEELLAGLPTSRC